MKGKNRWGSRDFQLSLAYGISNEDYEIMFDKQKGHCAICNSIPIKYPLQVDDDHKTGKVRGLLCLVCNLMLGKKKEQIENLSTNAIAYLKQHQV